MTRQTHLQTPAQVKQDFECRGESISNWALAHGFNPKVVYALLAGHLKGKRGESHKIAVALGIKADPAPKT